MAEYCPYDHGEVVIAPAIDSKQSQDSSGHTANNIGYIK
jgi:hypothetical protein